MLRFLVAVFLFVASLGLLIVGIAIPLLQGYQISSDGVILLLLNGVLGAWLLYVSTIMTISSWRQLRKQKQQPAIAGSAFEGLSDKDLREIRNSPEAIALRQRTNAPEKDPEDPER